MKEDDSLLKKIGKDNSFKVPEGYFEKLTPEVMSKLPEIEKTVVAEEPTDKWTRMKPLIYMAAMFLGAFLIIKVVSPHYDAQKIKDSTSDNITVTIDGQTEEVTDEMIDAALDNAMLDDYSLYVYLNDSDLE